MNDVRSWDTTHRVKLTKVSRLPDATVLYMTGWPGTLTRPVAIVVTADGSYHVIEPYRGLDFGDEIDPSSQPPEVLRERATWETQLMRAPLVVGDFVGFDPAHPRDDRMYGWFVDSAGTMTFRRTHGLPRGSRKQVYRLGWRGLPSHEVISVVPGVGIVRREYGHHGTLSEEVTTLVGFQRGGTAE